MFTNNVIFKSIVLFVLSYSTLAQTYCIPTYQIGCGVDDGINKFVLNGSILSVGSGCATNAYQFFNSSSANVVAGQSYQFTAKLLNRINDEFLTIWVDKNKDGDFSSTEVIFQTSSSVADSITSNLTIPPDLNGNVRLRVSVRFESAIPNACVQNIWGETEDYLLSVACPNNQNITQNIQATNTTYSAASSISASNTITAPSRVTYTAGNSILLQAGFSVENGSTFLGGIGGCTN